MWLMTPYCKALCDEKFSQLEGKGLKFSHTEQSHPLDFLIVWYSILKFWRCRSTLIFLFANNLPKVFPSGPVILKKQSQLPKILKSRVAEPTRFKRQITTCRLGQFHAKSSNKVHIRIGIREKKFRSGKITRILRFQQRIYMYTELTVPLFVFY